MLKNEGKLIVDSEYGSLYFDLKSFNSVGEYIQIGNVIVKKADVLYLKKEEIETKE